jgi:hypothetical protein
MSARFLGVVISAVILLLSASATRANWLVQCTDGLCSAEGCGTTPSAARDDCLRQCPFPDVNTTNASTSNCVPRTNSNPPVTTDLKRAWNYHGGCIAAWQHEIYFVKDCLSCGAAFCNLTGGKPGSIKIYDREYDHIKAQEVFNDCLITAFDDGTIHKTCAVPPNLGDRAINTSGRLVTRMYIDTVPGTTTQEMCVAFAEDGCYCDPDAEDFSGAHPGERRCTAP